MIRKLGCCILLSLLTLNLPACVGSDAEIQTALFNAKYHTDLSVLQYKIYREHLRSKGEKPLDYGPKDIPQIPELLNDPKYKDILPSDVARTSRDVDRSQDIVKTREPTTRGGTPGV